MQCLPQIKVLNNQVKIGILICNNKLFYKRITKTHKPYLMAFNCKMPMVQVPIRVFSRTNIY